MRLHIGLLKHEPGWEILLEQIGLSWGTLDPTRDFDPELFSLVIANAPQGLAQRRDLLAYVDGGGAVLATGPTITTLFPPPFARRRFSTVESDPLSTVHPDELVDVYTIGHARKIGPLYFVEDHGRGLLAGFPFDVGQLMTDVRTRRKNFYAPRRRLASEKVSAVSRGSLRRWLTAILEDLHLRRHLPFVHKWYFPDAAPTVFTFRVDSDGGSEADISDLYQLCDEYRIPTIWFLDTKSHERWLKRFTAFSGQEVGMHCYTHMTYPSLEENVDNFSHALLLLRAAGMSPRGGAAPFGMWNATVSEAFENLGLEYSSEFAVGYDDLPFFPWLGERFSKVLQLPIHPICIGSMTRERFTADEMLAHFVRTAERKVLLREPINFYHHPSHHHLDVIRSTFDWIAKNGIPHISYGAYSDWWRRRLVSQGEFHVNPSTGEIRSEIRSGNSVFWRVVHPSGEESLLRPESLMRLDALPKARREPTVPPPSDLSRTRARDLRHTMIDLLEQWYRRTQ